MRLAVLADIHGNAYALEAVLEDIAKRHVDITVNLGDIFYGPIAPKATWQLLQSHDFPSICGNQDRLLSTADPAAIASNPTLRFVRNQLHYNALTWLQSLPFDLQLEENIYLCHGCEKNDTTYLLEDIDSGQIRLREDKEISRLLGGRNDSLILCGHSHLPRIVSTTSGQLIVNPGSVGLPAYHDEEPFPHSMENFSYHARYALIEGSGTNWHVRQIHLDYDYTKARDAARQLGREDWAFALSTGRAL